MSLIRELRRRRVFRTAALYIVAAWVVLQVAALSFPGLDVPAGAIRYVWIAVILGFPAALVFGWRYQITSNGIVRTLPATAGEQDADLALKPYDYALLAGLVVVIVAITAGMVGLVRDAEQRLGVSAFGRTIAPNSIAVLPLDNLTGDTEQAFFVDGLQDAIISGLSQVSALRVTSRTSARRYGGAALTIPEIARELGVARIIEGSVLQTGTQVRITVQLIDAATDMLLWADNFSRDVRDIVSLQGEIARMVAEQVDVTLTPDELARLTSMREVDPQVYADYLRGMFFLKQLDPASIPSGIEYLDNAIGRDPLEPLAYAGLALGYNTIGHGVDAHGAFPKALAAARRALELDELSGEAWAALGEAQLYYDWDWAKADEAMQRALQLSPSLDHMHAHYAYLLALREDWETALGEAERARDLSPLDPIWAGFAAWLYMIVEQWDDGIVAAEECLSFAPGFPLCLYALGQIHSARGEYAEAVAVHEQIARAQRFRNWSLGPTYGLAGRIEDARTVAAEMESDPTPRDLLHLALTYSAMGEVDTAVDWLERAFEARSDWLPWIVLDNAYGGSVEPMRSHPRYQALVARLNLPNGDAAALD
jgi:TolB-like protein/tetratricopeptide (TPR) repeat protein